MHSTSKDQRGKPVGHAHSQTSKQSITQDLPSLGRIKVNITQTVPRDRIRKGPNAVVRSAALNDDIGIKRKYGEGSVPLFEREGVYANEVKDYESSPEEEFHKDGAFKKGQTRSSQNSQKQIVRKTQQISPVTTQTKQTPYVHRGCCGKSPPRKANNRIRSENKSSVSQTNTKVPYFRDEVREKDRLKRLYGDSRHYKSRSRSRSRTNHERHRRSRKSTSRGRHRDASPYKRSRSSSSGVHRSRRSQRDHSSQSRRRSNSGYRTKRSKSYSRSRERSRHKHCSRHSRDSVSPYISHKRYSKDRHRSRRSRSLSNERLTHSRNRVKEYEHDEPHKRQSSSIQSDMTSTFIPIPVPVPAEYAYSFPHFPVGQQSWPPHRPPANPYGFPMVPIMPPMRPIHPRYPGPNPYMQYAPLQYRFRPVNRFLYPKQNATNNQNRQKQQDKHK